MTHRLAPIVAPVCLLGLGSVLAAAFSFTTEHHSTSRLVGVAALLAASTLASHFPVPLAGPNSGGVSLSFVFGASAIVLFGWDAGELAAPVLRTDPGEPAVDARDLRADGLGRAHARRALAALAGALGRARRAAARDRALPALHEPGAESHAPGPDRPADRARQPSA